MRACLIFTPFRPRSPAMPTVVAVPVTMPAHLGCRLGILLNRCGGARIGQRQRLGALGGAARTSNAPTAASPRSFVTFICISHEGCLDVTPTPCSRSSQPPRRDAWCESWSKRRECDVNACAAERMRTGAKRFPLRMTTISQSRLQTGLGCRPYLLQLALQEIVMASFRNMMTGLPACLRRRINGRRYVGDAGPRLPRPRRRNGLRKHFTQLAMAIWSGGRRRWWSAPD